MLRTKRTGRGASLAVGTVLATGVLATALSLGAAPGAVAAPSSPAATSTVRHVLFDDSKSETAGNADWITSTSMPDPLQENPNPQTESDWTGAISSWGVALQKSGGYSLDTLPPGNTITYGVSSNPLDLSHFDTFVLPEPQDQLSSAEKAAVMHFVQNGGGLFLIVDHTGSDRNNNGWDSPQVVNDLLTNNGVDDNDPFGFSVDQQNIVNDYPQAISDTTNPVLNGPFGTVTGSVIYNGNTETLHPADNPNVKGLLYTTGSTPGGTSGAFFTTSTFGSGRVAIWGDSSAIDDGTGQSGNNLHDGWDDPKGTDAPLGLNATAWLASGGSSTGGNTVTLTNPGNRTTTVGNAVSLQMSGTDSAGAALTYSATGLPTGLSISTGGLISGTPTAVGTSDVTVTATDSTGASGSTSFTWTVNGQSTETVSVTSPGDQAGTAGSPVSLQISATDSAGNPLTYSATGLPAGLSVSSGGLISGTPTTAGTSSVTVTATSGTASGSTSFSWTVNPASGGCTAAQLLGNPGFETGSASPWTTSSGVVSNSTGEPAHSGSWDAWLDGYGSTHTDTLAQSVTVPAACTNTAFSFWLHVDTAETSTTTAYDTLKVQVLNGSGTVLATLATYSNLDHNSGYVQHTLSLAPYAGQTVTLRFTGAEDQIDQTSVVIDDTAVNTA